MAVRTAKQNGTRWRKGEIPAGATPFKPGESGNPNGRPPAGLSVREWWNQMAEWSLVEIRAVMNDVKAPVSKLAAARAWIHASSDALNNGGTPIAGPDLERIIEHTAGKATQPLTVQADVSFTLNIGNASGSPEPSEN